MLVCPLLRSLCLLLQRYTFWSNSQLRCCALVAFLYCACYCKDTHFEAIHNRIHEYIKTHYIVLATAKIHILKQFTTLAYNYKRLRLLCLLLQRYTFWSNSQLSTACCANSSIVLATAKIHILKQFTTETKTKQQWEQLCLLLQRYTFWSNSQRRWKQGSPRAIVLATAKIHILKQFTTTICE